MHKVWLKELIWLVLGNGGVYIRENINPTVEVDFLHKSDSCKQGMQLVCASDWNHRRQSEFDLGNSFSDHGECIRLLCLACDADNEDAQFRSLIRSS